MSKTYVTTSEKASIFHDQTTGITVLKGEIKELNEHQLNSKRIKAALSSGHLVYTKPEVKDNPSLQAIREEEVKTLNDKFIKLYKKGTDNNKLVKQFSLEDLKDICKLHDITPEDGDTAMDLVESLVQEFEEKK